MNSPTAFAVTGDRQTVHHHSTRATPIGCVHSQRLYCFDPAQSFREFPKKRNDFARAASETLLKLLPNLAWIGSTLLFGDSRGGGLVKPLVVAARSAVAPGKR
jgi:hypothetical protein